MSQSYSEIPPGGIISVPPSIPSDMLYRVKSLAGISKQTLKLVPLSGQTIVTNGLGPMRADVWYGDREVASKQAQWGTCWWNNLFTQSTCPAGIEPTPSRQTVLQEGTGVCAGAQSLRRPQPLDSRLQASSPACHVGLVDAKHTGPRRPGSGPGKSPARADHHDARQGVPCATLGRWSVKRPPWLLAAGDEESVKPR